MSLEVDPVDIAVIVWVVSDVFKPSVRYAQCCFFVGFSMGSLNAAFSVFCLSARCLVEEVHWFSRVNPHREEYSFLVAKYCDNEFWCLRKLKCRCVIMAVIFYDHDRDFPPG